MSDVNTVSGLKRWKQKQNVLLKMSKGTFLGIAGNIFQITLNFVCIASITRYISKEEFGFLSLSLGFISILSIISSFGFERSLPTFIAKKLQAENVFHIWGGICSSFTLSMCMGIIFTFLLYLLADHIALILNKPGLFFPIRILSISIPFIISSSLMMTYLQSFHNIWGKLYRESLTPLIRLFFIMIIVIWHLSFTLLLWAHVLSFFLVALFLFFYARKQIAQFFIKAPCFTVMKELLRNSLPLFMSSFILIILFWTDTLILSFYVPADEVGAYSAGTRLARLLQIIYSSAGYIYLPIASKLHLQNRNDALKLLYSFSAKWIVLLSLPFFIFFFLAPNDIMGFVFGPQYGYGNDFFCLLSLGFFSLTLFGLSEITLIAFGKNNFVLLCLIIVFVCNIALDFLLIPLYGKSGAATASSISIIAGNILTAVFVYKFSGVHSMTIEYLKIIFLLFVGVSVLTLLIEINLIDMEIWMLLLFSFIIMPLAFILTKSFSVEDIMVFKEIKRKVINKYAS